VTYPKPATPLPWPRDKVPANLIGNCVYINRAANAFPHLVSALEAMVDRWEPDTEGLDRVMWENACEALAIARGEVKP
jgi:hypothetical protein